MSPSKTHALIFAAASLVALPGCDQQMARQPSYRPLQPSAFFADQRASRPLIEGTIARGHLQDDREFFEGKHKEGPPLQKAAALIGAGAQGPMSTAAVMPRSEYVTEFPLSVDRKLLKRGRERFDIFCAPCHDRAGTGTGMIVRRGFARPPVLHEERLRRAPAGYLFDVISRGRGAMPDYAVQIAPADRWTIVAYVRALQLSQHAALDDVPPEQRKKGGTP